MHDPAANANANVDAGGAQPLRPVAGAALAPTERATLALIADGLNTSGAAVRLGVSEDTVKSTLRRVQGKVGARGRPAILDTAYRNGQILPPARLPVPTGAEINDDQLTLLRMLASGATAGHMATTTNRSLEVTKARLKRLYNVLGASTAAHAVRLGWERGYLDQSTSLQHPGPAVASESQPRRTAAARTSRQL